MLATSINISSSGFLSYTPQRNYVAPDRGDRQLTDILEVLATARSSTNITLGQMVALESQHIARGSTVIIISSSTNLDWLGEAHSQARRGIMVIAVLINPTSFGLQGIDFDLIRKQVESAGITVYTVNQGDNLSTTLSYQYMVKSATTNAT